MRRGAIDEWWSNKKDKKDFGSLAFKPKFFPQPQSQKNTFENHEDQPRWEETQLTSVDQIKRIKVPWPLNQIFFLNLSKKIILQIMEILKTNLDEKRRNRRVSIKSKS